MSNGDNSKANGRSKRPSSFISFASIWQAPRSKLKGKGNAEPDEVVVYDSDESNVEEGPTYTEPGAALTTRERSNSMPTSPVLDDAASYFTAGGDDLELSLSQTSSKRRSTPLSPMQRDYLASEGMLHLEGTLSKTNTLRRQRTAASLEVPSPISTQPHSRGYPWRKEVEGGSYIHPSHRNPTGKQAFYDTHFGSSSGWRSVAGIADEYLHPFDSGRAALGRWTGRQREKVAPTRSAKLFDDRRKESLLSWTGLQTMSAFGLSSSKENKDRSHLNAADAPSDNMNAYEPELIPTVHRDAQASQYFKNLEGNIVILGGYRGSILRDAETHQMMWVPLKVGVGLRRPTLEIDLTKEAEDKSEEKVFPDEMLSAIGSMVDMGKRLIHRCSRKKTKVYSWGYDWRLSLGRSSERLERFLQDLYMKSAEKVEDRKGAKVIAHSMGGLVALHALSRTKRPEIFEGLIFASTPFLGTANILGPFRFGDAAMFNDEICSPRATFSFRSSFYLLPVDPDVDSESGTMNTAGGRCFEEEDGTPHDLDFLNPETWNDLGFSPCVEMGKRKEVLEKSRRRAKARGCSLSENLQRSASIREEQGVRRRFERRGASNNAVPSFPGPDMQLTPSTNAEQNGNGNVSRTEAVIDRATDGAMEAAKAGQSALNKSGKETDNSDTLQPANRQESTTQQPEDMLSDEEWEHILEDEATSAWLYLEEVLAETRKFTEELRNGFNAEYHREGRYPPIAILTSGRTPTVRGALTAATTSDAPKDAWKKSAREGDYSRMLYAPGDGVILRKSSTTLPGEWSSLLVRGKKETDLTNAEGVVETSHRHVSLLSDVDGIGRCLEACRLARLHSK